MVASENNLPSVLGAVVQIIAALAASGVLTLSLRLIWQVRKGREARLRTEPVRKPSLLEAEQAELIALRRAWTEELEARYRRVLQEQDAWYTRLSAEQDRRWRRLETQSQEL